MSKRCELQGINYWPVPVEGDGQTSANFEAFLKNVSDAASELRNLEIDVHSTHIRIAGCESCCRDPIALTIITVLPIV